MQHAKRMFEFVAAPWPANERRINSPNYFQAVPGASGALPQRFLDLGAVFVAVGSDVGLLRQSATALRRFFDRTEGT